MRLDSARGLKAALQRSVIAPLSESVVARSAAIRTATTTGLPARPPTMALGLSRKGRDNYVLAVRVQAPGLENSPQLDIIRSEARGEVDVRTIGLVTALGPAAGPPTPPWHQARCRPLRIGGSVGHVRVTAGTLGAFVRGRDDGAILLLSNNHVLANENHCKKGDTILQPGVYDGGKDPADRVGTLHRFARLRREGSNVVDAAVATVDDGVAFDHRSLDGLGTLAGLGDAVLAPDDAVAKVGRTTGTTRGKVSAIELDGVVVRFGIGLLTFDGQVEVDGAGSGPFSDGGDSGSLIVDADRRGVGLLFAASTSGGRNARGLTFANPLRYVLDALKVDLHVP